MAQSLNKVQLIGNLGLEPEIRYFDNGDALARIRIATSETYNRKDGERVDLTEWHTVNFRKGLAEVVAKYLHKGDKVYIEGRLRTRSWQDQATKETRYATEVQADNMIMLGGGNREQAPNSNHQNPESTPSAHTETEDDLPF